MFRLVVLPAIAVIGAVFAVVTVIRASIPHPPPPPIVEPPVSPFAHALAGSGLIEARTENIKVGVPVSGVVAEVYVNVGQRVKKGDKLFRLDDRSLRAEIDVRKANLQQARSNLDQLLAQPRPEELPPVEAKVRQARVAVDDTKDMLERTLKISETASATTDEVKRRRFAYDSACESLAQVEAELSLLKAGPPRQVLDVARAQIAALEAQVQAVEIELDRLTITARDEGTVLQITTRPGEFANASPPAMGIEPLMLLGDTDVLHVRVDIDENDASSFRDGLPAKALIRGKSDVQIPLRFVRREAYIKPKRSLTGDSNERVDTRVLQVIYSFDAGDWPVFVGQQVDVYIDLSAATKPASQPQARAPLPTPTTIPPAAFLQSKVAAPAQRIQG